MENKGFVEEFALFVSLSVSMIGVGLFYAPSILAKYVGQNGWISILITGIQVFVIIYLIYKVMVINEFKDLTVILNDSYGRVIGKIISLMYSILTLIVLTLSLRSFSEIITMYLLKNTPTEAIIATFIFIGMYLSRGGLANVVHFNEVVFWIMFIPIAIMLLLTIPAADFTNLLPIGGYDIKNYFLSSFEMLFLFNGFSMAFILIPYVKKQKRIKSVIFKSSIFTTVFYIVIVVLVSATLSPKQAADSIFPTITMLQSIISGSGILEKWDSLVMSLWVIFYFTSFANIYYFISIIIKDVFNIEDVRTSSMIYVPFVYIIAILPENIIEVRNLRFNYLRMSFIALLLIIILLTLIISIFKKRRVVNEK